MKEYDVVLTITHVRAESEDEAVSKAKADTFAIHNAMGEAIEIHDFILKSIDRVESKDEAQDIAKEWQQWASEQSLSYSELADYGYYFTALADKFGLTEEFKENGII